MNTFTVQANEKTSKILIELFKALGLSFQVKKGKPSNDLLNYKPEFVKMILEAKSDEGEFILTDEYKKDLFKGV